ncbi:MAG: DUF6338 family protein, partial [bacterium]
MEFGDLKSENWEIFLLLVLPGFIAVRVYQLFVPTEKKEPKFFFFDALVFGLVMYICSTASVPMVHAFITQGMSAGAGLILLIAGPVT